ncbi:MAG: hypothetical protein DRJ66_05010 [Thermoprotei archaeon]|nr:MAG: hypothetical protein DRJ66_05010 [Thermoprotei archaeon]RLF19724.1 MAG: hypothetical protein DRZ82_04705 [Thermoprotei archaeon]
MKRILILYVDRDDDIGVKAGVKTPIIGRDANLKAALLFALRDPEDSDVNALFAAIQLFDSFRKQEGISCEIATIAGDPNGGIEADLRIRRQLDEVLKVFKPDGVILVSDGADDEQVVPIVQSKVPIISVRRVVVVQSRSVEETYMMLIRYMKKLYEDPRYKKVALGFPGLLILVLSLLAALNYLEYATLAFGIILGLFMVLKGFSLDERIVYCYKRFENWWRSAPILFFTTLISIVCLIVGTYVGIEGAMGSKEYGVNYMLAMFLLAPDPNSALHAIDILIVSAIIALLGRVLHFWLTSGIEVYWQYITGIVFLLLSRQIFLELALLVTGVGSLIILLYWVILTMLISAFLTVFFMLRERLKKGASKE